MGGSASLHTIAFVAVVVMILLAAWIALVLESAGHPPGRKEEAATLSDEPGHAIAPDREAAQ